MKATWKWHQSDNLRTCIKRRQFAIDLRSIRHRSDPCLLLTMGSTHCRLDECRFHVISTSFSCHFHVIFMSFSGSWSSQFTFFPYSFMSFSCHFHVISISFPCRFHVVSTPFSCRFQAMVISFSCNCPVIFMSLPCHFHVVFMSFSGLGHLIFHFSSHLHVMFMSFPCRFHVIFMLFSFRLRVISTSVSVSTWQPPKRLRWGFKPFHLQLSSLEKNIAAELNKLITTCFGLIFYIMQFCNKDIFFWLQKIHVFSDTAKFPKHQTTNPNHHSAPTWLTTKNEKVSFGGIPRSSSI